MLDRLLSAVHGSEPPVLSEALADALRANDRRVSETGTPLHIEEVVPTRGQDRTYISVKFPLRDQPGHELCVMVQGVAPTAKMAEEVAMIGLRQMSHTGECLTPLMNWRVFLSVAAAAAAYALARANHLEAARAIMTTDTVPKVASVTVDGFTVGGMAKGAGMLAPALATMLVVVSRPPGCVPVRRRGFKFARAV